jgi:hypothetical protein
LISGSINVPNEPGLYVLRAVRPYARSFPELSWGAGNILYVGQASDSLVRRFRDQEIMAKGHGTFFRSIGVVLGHKPEPGCLCGKDHRNFIFSTSDNNAIKLWMAANLEYVAFKIGEANGLSLKELDTVEKALIVSLSPAINISHNPNPSRLIVRDLRKEAIEYARKA